MSGTCPIRTFRLMIATWRPRAVNSAAISRDPPPAAAEQRTRRAAHRDAEQQRRALVLHFSALMPHLCHALPHATRPSALVPSSCRNAGGSAARRRPLSSSSVVLWCANARDRPPAKAALPPRIYSTQKGRSSPQQNERRKPRSSIFFCPASGVFFFVVKSAGTSVSLI